jgi:putative acetyltransferase
VGADQEGVAVEIGRATTADDWRDADRLIRDYLDGLPFVVDFQDVENELADLSVTYGGSDNVVLLVRDDDGDAVGVVGVKRFDEHDAELKRMYLDPRARGTGAGRALAVAAIAEARSRGYRRLLLDTVARLATAIAIYETLGFVEIDAYRFNPMEDARYFALDLSAV